MNVTLELTDDQVAELIDALVEKIARATVKAKDENTQPPKWVSFNKRLASKLYEARYEARLS